MLKTISNNEDLCSQSVYCTRGFVSKLLPKKILLFLFISVIFIDGNMIPIYAQQPSSFMCEVQPIELVECIVPEPIDLQAVRLEDELREQEGAPYRFAISRPVKVTPCDHGTWEKIEDGISIWRLRITSPGARSINLGFRIYFMPPGGSMFVYSADGRQVHGPFTEGDNKDHGLLWTPLIYSEDIILEVTIPDSATATFELELTSINHGYRGFDPLLIDKGLGDADYCHVNVACPEGDPWRDQIRSVARCDLYDFLYGSVSCTGNLINNTAEDCMPYFLTAFHCFDFLDYGGIDGIIEDPQGLAASIIVYWNFEASTCSGTYGSLGQQQSGSTYRAGYYATDFVLVELDNPPDPSYNVYYAGWDRSSTAPSSGVAIHHPKGDLKKISFEYSPLSVTSFGGYSSPGDGTHLRVADWDYSGTDEGTTESGSSGCPIFNSSKRVTGNLHGGYAACGNNESDWFGRFYRSWTGGGTSSTSLSNWLDPLSTGLLTLDGKNPCVDPCQPTEYPSTDVPKSIPDSGTTISTLEIADNCTINDLNVKLNINHTWDGDLDVYLIAPDDTRIELFTDVGGSGANFIETILDDEASIPITSGSAPFSGSYQPEGNLSNLDGKSISGTWTLEVTDDSSSDTGTLNSWSLLIETDCEPFETIEGFETGDFSSFPWIHSGSADWVITADEKNSGVYSARAGTISDNQITSLEVTLDCISGDIKFYRKVSSETSYDYLDFYIDGISKGSWSGEQDWGQVFYPVLAGTRTFKWSYSKDGSFSSGSDTAWIDDIAFPTEPDSNCCPTTITSYPYTESFESDFGDWIDASGDDIDWTRYSGSTPSSSTGPSSACDGTYYLYTEASSSGYPDKQAILEGPCFDLSSLSNPELRFCYHMYGIDMGDLSLEVSDGNCTSWIAVWSLSGNQGDSWYEAAIDLSAYSGSTIKVRIIGVTGSNYKSDMAIDYVTVADVALDAPVLKEEPNVTPGLRNTIWWDPVPGDNWYYAQCANDINFAHTIMGSGRNSETSCTFTGLNLGQTYWYRIKATHKIERWSQTSQAEFQTGTLIDTTATSGGDVVLAGDSVILFEDNFEDGDMAGWMTGSGSYTREVTNATAAAGSLFSITLIGGSDSHDDGIFHDLTAITPDNITFYVRSSDTSKSDGYFVVGTGTSNDQTAVFFFAKGIGQIGVYDGTTFWGTTYDSLTWYKIRFAFNWNSKQIDYYVNDSLVRSGITFRSTSVSSLTKAYLYNYNNSQAWWDEIKFYNGSVDYISPGTIISTQIDLLVGGSWGDVNFSKTTPANTSLTVDVLDASDDSVILADVASGTDLRGIAATSIKLCANLSTDDPNNTPVLHDWSVSYAEPCESDWSNVESSLQCDTLCDFDNNNKINFADFTILSGQWLQAPGSPSADIAPEVPDGFVDFLDLAVFVENWLLDLICTMPQEECFPSTHPDYANWVTVGKPDCWCCPTQCNGDTNCDGVVDDGDLLPIQPLIGVVYPDPSYNPCFDLDHNLRINLADLNIMNDWYNQIPPSNCLEIP